MKLAQTLIRSSILILTCMTNIRILPEHFLSYRVDHVFFSIAIMAESKKGAKFSEYFKEFVKIDQVI